MQPVSPDEYRRDPTDVVGERVAAYIIDVLLLFLAGAPGMALLIAAAAGNEDGDYGALAAVGVVLVIVLPLGFVLWNWLYSIGRTGKSLGKRWLHITVVAEETLEPPGYGKEFLRGVGGIVDLQFNGLLGLLLIAVTDRHRRLGDMFGRTIVVRDDALM